MTDLIDRADSGEIPSFDDLGLEATRDLSAHRRRDTTGELTQNLAHEMAGLPPRRRPASDQTAKTRLIDMPIGMTSAAAEPRVIEIDDTVTFRTLETANVVDLEGPQKPPPPLPKPKDPAETGVNIFGRPGKDLPEPDSYFGRHRHPDDMGEDLDWAANWDMRHPAHERRLSPWVLVGVAVVGLAMWAGLVLAGAAVIW